jgi:hypothetical protein
MAFEVMIPEVTGLFLQTAAARYGIREVDILITGGVIRGPGDESRAVGVSLVREVGPILLHDVCQALYRTRMRNDTISVSEYRPLVNEFRVY